jgi:NAD(P)-dependent dehydrogenase (short-subunit alcohol dehydrogenase family)
MTQAIEENVVVITGASNEVGHATARPLAHKGAKLALGVAAQIGGRWSPVADEPSHIHIPRPSRVMRSNVDGR